jgi:hypothetical protein
MIRQGENVFQSLFLQFSVSFWTDVTTILLVKHLLDHKVNFNDFNSAILILAFKFPFGLTEGSRNPYGISDQVGELLEVETNSIFFLSKMRIADFNSFCFYDIDAL